MEESLLNVFRQFFPQAESIPIQKIGDGHIHITYKAVYKSGFILQKINKFVFSDIPSLMNNISLISRKLKEETAYPLSVSELIYSISGLPYYQDDEGDYWRVSTYIPDSKSYRKPLNPDLALEGGKALGIFTSTVSSFDIDNFIEILPNFHDINHRWKNYQDAKAVAPKDRFREAGSDLHTADTYYQLMHKFYHDLITSDIPLRVTHNDTKFNNFLFDTNDKALSIIDLDTVMPGYTLFDFGDAIRTVGNSAEEDERDSCNIRFNYKHCHAFTQGFFSQLSGVLSKDEIKLMTLAPLYITYLQGLRFLTDHLNGDVYYPARYFGHNLVRASAQFTLMKQMEDKIQMIENSISQALEYSKIKVIL